MVFISIAAIYPFYAASEVGLAGTDRCKTEGNEGKSLKAGFRFVGFCVIILIPTRDARHPSALPA
jgi:hypothetical protein